MLIARIDEPILLELLWSYWHEEGMLMQAINAIALRFQNVRAPGERDPLAYLEIDPLRPLNNVLWGYIQDEPNRLTVSRRAYEYQHAYGLTLYGKAVRSLHPAESRSKFIEGFHNLLHAASVFYKEDNDTTVIADGYPKIAVNHFSILERILSESDVLLGRRSRRFSGRSRQLRRPNQSSNSLGELSVQAQDTSENVLYKGSLYESSSPVHERARVVAIEHGIEVDLDTPPEFSDGHPSAPGTNPRSRLVYTWGYRGTGPRQLAEAIAWHYLRYAREFDYRERYRLEKNLYELVSRLDQNSGFTITREMMLDLMSQDEDDISARR